MSKAGVLIWRHIFESGDEKRIVLQHPDISELEIIRDIPYINDNEQGHLLDVCRRIDGSKNDPVMINIHGGGLFASYKEVNRHFNYEIAKMGYTVISLNYRRIPETTLIHQIEDVMAAMRYIEKHAEDLNISLDHVYLSGDSAGALLSMYVLALHRSRELCTIFNIRPSGINFRAGCFISIMCDTQRKDMMMAISDVVTDRRDRAKPYEKYMLDPLSVLNVSSLPPVIQFTSIEDAIHLDSLKVQRHLREHGIEHEMHDYPLGSGRVLVHVFSVMYPDWPESREVYGFMDKWFKEH